MAQLPPKVPNMTQNWHDTSHHQRMPSMDSLGLAASNGGPSWADEFLDFSLTKRGSHRRSVSTDSIAFLDQIPMAQMEQKESRRSSAPGSRRSATEFDGFDEEQFMAMFIDDTTAVPTVSCSNPSSPSDHSSMDDDKHNNLMPLNHDQQMKKQQKTPVESEEMESASDGQHEAFGNASTENYNDKIFDPKRIKRILANRQSAQRSRVKKLHYISELELGVNSLQAEVSVLSPRVAYLDHQRLVLNVDNSVLKQRLAALAQDKLFKDAHQEALKREIERLRQVYYQQNLKKMDNDDSTPKSAKSLLQSPENISNPANGSVHSEQIMIS
ncbi:Basic leucine zipper 61 [Heracleum sosnowskyi]|uniref:Basic leucine zipper 61 n=1 Tax=Heracleum sosnowskyi TaxID=360622 RepID=A0AAD8JNU2_9APIA|nr:Basic leucine zipper 61 [Heracleum sosnowskyi]